MIYFYRFLNYRYVAEIDVYRSIIFITFLFTLRNTSPNPRLLKKVKKIIY